MNEITSNVWWRVLQLRGYVNEKHELTAWGKFLHAALSKSSMSTERAESIFLVAELLKLNILDKTVSSSKDQGPSSKLNSGRCLYFPLTDAQGFGLHVLF